jgi:hypothetical protein
LKKIYKPHHILTSVLATPTAMIVPIDTKTKSDADRHIEHLPQFEPLITYSPDNKPAAVPMQSNILGKALESNNPSSV